MRVQTLQYSEIEQGAGGATFGAGPMKNLKLVEPGTEPAAVAGAEAEKPTGLTMPKHFKAAQKAAWADLMESTDAALRVKENRFTFEMAAVLMAKFRSGKPMNATETKELKKQLVELGLAKDDDGGAPKKSKNAAKYFGDS
jgi:hypothetical protein